MDQKSNPYPLDYYLKLKYPVTLYPEEEGGFTVEILDLPGCISQGETVEEALEMIEDARRKWIETAYKHGDEIPLPASERRYSGRVLVRMPRSLHRKLALAAEREGVSLNQYIVTLLSEKNALALLKGEFRIQQDFPSYSPVASSRREFMRSFLSSHSKQMFYPKPDEPEIPSVWLFTREGSGTGALEQGTLRRRS
ncbi:MAG: toxin-antitoxin system HicB family antitoxin [Armatimonadota bacterium]|nr:toxin-antitoxin system HicB family antitoxin [Armatimonadota bacterium]